MAQIECLTLLFVNKYYLNFKKQGIAAFGIGLASIGITAIAEI